MPVAVALCALVVCGNPGTFHDDRPAYNEIRLEPAIDFVSPGQSDTWTEGEEVTLVWRSRGDVERIQVYYYGVNCPLGGRSRGTFGDFLANRQFNLGSVTWTVPKFDSIHVTVRIAGFDAADERLGADERVVGVRPAVMKDIEGTAIAIDKSRQRLYYQEDGVMRRMHLVSTAARGYTTPKMEPGSSGRRGRMGQVFYRSRNPYSRMYEVHMPYWMAITSSGSHGIHATSPNLYYRLGRPASHGCVRQHRRDAKALWDMVVIGTPVYVF